MGKREKPREKKIFRVIMALTIWLAVIAVFAAAFWNGLTATLYEIKFPDLPEPFDGYTIVHLSDLHGARFGENQSRLIRRIDRLNPDIVVLTGDMHCERLGDTEPVVELISRLRNNVGVPVYFISGNHERYGDTVDYRTLRRLFTEAGGTDLDDTYIYLQRGGAAIRLYGLANYFTRAPEQILPRVHAVFPRLPEPGEFSILLYHESDSFPALSTLPFQLVLAGHTHGGQIRLPFVGGLMSPYRTWLPDYAGGRFDARGSVLISSRGLGGGRPVPRIFNPPEIVVVRLMRT